jgi:hypothetical protein
MPARMTGRHKYQRGYLSGLVAAVLLALGMSGATGPGAAAASPPPAAAPAAAGPAVGGTIRPVPPEIQVPPGNTLIARFAARGVQVYQCPAGTWTFLEPAAVLGDRNPAAVHFRGPSWESTRDGSLVTGTAVASLPVTGSIPQLLLQAASRRGTGIFGAVTYIQRLNTSGGAAPTTACVAGQTRGVPYTAEYRFYIAS